MSTIDITGYNEELIHQQYKKGLFTVSGNIVQQHVQKFDHRGTDIKRNILFVTSHNFFELQHGVHTRFFELVKYFKSTGYRVDIFSPEEYGNGWKNTQKNNPDLINRVYIHKSSMSFMQYLKNIIIIICPFLKRWKIYLWLKMQLKKIDNSMIKAIPDLVNDQLSREFRSFVNSSKYDYIIISYVHWAKLLDNEEFSNYKKIILIEDIITYNLYDAKQIKSPDEKILKEEIARINLFDIAICISEVEMKFLSQYPIKPTFYYIPFFMDKKKHRINQKYEYDVLFIGSNNNHNIMGINWFFSNVYPLLDEGCKILIVGLIADHVPKKNNVKTLRFAEDLDRIYFQCKFSISPLLGGTGQKIKVVEALAYGKPVVCTTKGAIGIPGKNNGCLVTDSPEEFASIMRRLINNNYYYMKNSSSAYECFIMNFTKDKIYERLDTIFN